MTAGLGQILQALGDRGLRRSGDGWAARCPAHEDKSPSLSITEDATTGKILLKCHAGCEVKAVMEALRLPMSTLFPEQTTGTPNANSAQKPKEQIEAIYDYKDESGKLLFQVVKNRVPGSPDKRFFQRRPDGKDGWINDVKGVKPVLYRLPELLASPRDRVVYTPEANAESVAGFLGLRLNEGVEIAGLEREFGPAMTGPALETVARLVKAGLLTSDGQTARLTARGQLLSNDGFQEFLGPRKSL